MVTVELPWTQEYFRFTQLILCYKLLQLKLCGNYAQTNGKSIEHVGHLIVNGNAPS